MAKTTIKKEELMEETKELENVQEEEIQENDEQNLPAEVNEKKGFHPIQFVKGKVTEFGENHPKVISGMKTAGKVGAGVAIGAAGTVAILASIAKHQGDAEDLEDLSEDDDEDVIDSTATELNDEE